MSALTTSKSGTTERAPADLSGRLQWLRKFGKPRLTFSSSGNCWLAVIEMNTNAEGCSFEVKAGFGSENFDTPEQAIDSLISRMLEALRTLGAA